MVDFFGSASLATESSSLSGAHLGIRKREREKGRETEPKLTLALASSRLRFCSAALLRCRAASRRLGQRVRIGIQETADIQRNIQRDDRHSKEQRKTVDIQRNSKKNGRHSKKQ